MMWLIAPALLKEKKHVGAQDQNDSEVDLAPVGNVDSNRTNPFTALGDSFPQPSDVYQPE